jgi:hypothetical protein
LTANIVANQLFYSLDLLKNNTNYSTPNVTWVNSNVNLNLFHTGTIAPPLPFNLGFSMNANLFSLFNSFPRTAYNISSEKYYRLTLGGSDYDAVIAHPRNSYMNLALSGIDLPFNESPYLVDGIYTTQRKASTNYTYDTYYISQRQEISTIDTWSPVSSIVFTTSTLPIIINQSSAKATIGPEEFSQVVSSGFDLIITDLQTNQQGSRPNVLYNPSAEYRRIDMTGNLPIQIIDISVKWRARTGQIMNFYLPRGGSCSLKILFERKDKKGNDEFKLRPGI